MPLIITGGKLLTVGSNKLATSTDCCCDEEWPDPTPDDVIPEEYDSECAECDGIPGCIMEFLDVCIRDAVEAGCIAGARDIDSGTVNLHYPHIPQTTDCVLWGKTWDPSTLVVNVWSGADCTAPLSHQLDDLSISVNIQDDGFGNTFVDVLVFSVAGVFWHGEDTFATNHCGPWIIPNVPSGANDFFTGGEAQVKMCIEGFTGACE